MGLTGFFGGGGDIKGTLYLNVSSLISVADFVGREGGCPSNIVPFPLIATPSIRAQHHHRMHHVLDSFLGNTSIYPKRL